MKIGDNDKPRFETERLVLRCFELSDAEELYRNLVSDPEVSRFMCYDTCEDLGETLKHIDRWLDFFSKLEQGSSWCIFSIILKSTGELIGTIDYHVTDREAQAAEIGYKLGTAWWRKGYATEALHALIDYLFKEVGLNRLWADHDSRNIASGRVLLKAGMLCEGTARQCYVRKGHLVDKVSYAILKSDWEAKKYADEHTHYIESRREENAVL